MAPPPLRGALRLRQGETLAGWRFRLRQDGVTPVDLTGASAHMTVRSRADATTTILDLTDLNGGVVIDAAGGVVEPYAADEVTALLAPGVYDGDLFVQLSTGKRICLWDDVFVVLAASTRDP